ncbi:MAG: TonB-dependent receptor plug domain-containing protein [Flavobacteriales bacterium]|nr:TonB-dependent receptor plug domain-containing protein [Flavobacteriales bacterium]
MNRLIVNLRSLATTLSISTGFIASAQEPASGARLIQIDPLSVLTNNTTADWRNQTTTIADLASRDLREAPANVQVITARQIQAAGARDLLEALQLVPGIGIGRDVDDVLGVGIHGNWAHEGKCLFLLNGAQLNENDFGTYGIGQRIPIENVERIEVIVGPGSIVHGGYAALGVVNIVTRDARQKVGAQLVARTGWYRNAATRTSTTLSGAQPLGRDQELSFALSHLRGNRSNAIDLLPDGTTIDRRDSSALQASTFQFNYRWKNLKAYMYYMDESAEVSDANFGVRMRDVLFGAESRIPLRPSLDLAWKLSHADQIPWYYVDTPDPERLASNTNNQRSSVSILLSYTPNAWLSARIGVQGFHQRSEYSVRDGQGRFAMNDGTAIGLNDGAVLGEINLRSKLGLLSAGYRLEHNSLTGTAHAPRIAYSLVAGRFHAKLMYSQAFRSPTVMNLNYGPAEGSIVTEYITTTEAELGLRIGSRAMVVANIYNTRIDDPIVYVYDAVTLDNYLNRSRSGTRGSDVRLNIEAEKWLLLFGGGAAKALPYADIPEADLPEGTGVAYQGLPAARMFAAGSWSVLEWLAIRGRADWQGSTWSYQVVDAAEGAMELVQWPSTTLLNAGLIVKPGSQKRMSIDLGIANLLDRSRQVLSPVDNGLNPYLLNGRELTFSLAYDFVR